MSYCPRLRGNSNLSVTFRPAVIQLVIYSDVVYLRIIERLWIWLS